MLYCDAKGKVHTSIIKKSEYLLARRRVKKLEYAHRHYATIGLQGSEGEYQPLVVEINPEELWALEHIFDHAVSRGELPDILIKYPGQIIGRAETTVETTKIQGLKRKSQYPLQATPQVLYRLSYYSGDNIEFPMPIYKTSHKYPLIVLKRLAVTEYASLKIERVLILDDDGDLGIIRISKELMDKAEKGMNDWQKHNKREGCMLLSLDSQELSVSYLEISSLQKTALDTVTKYFEMTEHERQPFLEFTQPIIDQIKRVNSHL
ncbi:hypothetical protein ACFLTV_00425 [Chloroflexota bacterium]